MFYVFYLIPFRCIWNYSRVSSGKFIHILKGYLQGRPSGIRQFWAAESPLKMMKNAFYFALFVLKIFKILS